MTDLKEIVIELGKTYTGSSYDLLERNCNHFAAEFVEILTGQQVPSWINRLAFISNSLKCLIPQKYLPTVPMPTQDGIDEDQFPQMQQRHTLEDDDLPDEFAELRGTL
jgi:hypothetical protein